MNKGILHLVIHQDSLESELEKQDTTLERRNEVKGVLSRINANIDSAKRHGADVVKISVMGQWIKELYEQRFEDYFKVMVYGGYVGACLNTVEDILTGAKVDFELADGCIIGPISPKRIDNPYYVFK